MSVEYKIYRKEILNFLQTVSIKFDLFADMMEDRLRKEKGIVINSQYENPYYQNLCGQYSIFDTPIYITTIETGEEVLFDVNLKDTYPKTAALYKIPSQEFDILCQLYPNQIGLIKSIIYPAKNLSTVINASNLSVVAGDPTLLHNNERESLLTTLDRTLDYILERWYIADYIYEETYPVAFMGIVWAILPQALLAQRIANLRTNNVHPMHIWEYLATKGLKDYRDILNDKQSLFLYKNINYILQNKGKKATLELLADNLLKDLQVSLVGKTILQQTTTRKEDCITVPEFLSEDIVKFDTSEQLEETAAESLSQIIYRISNEGYYPDVNADMIVEKEVRFGETEFNIIPTRLLELQKAVLNTPYEKVLVKFLFDSLIMYYAKNKLNYEIKFVDPNLNLPVTLSIGDTLALFQYVHYKEVGIEVTPSPIIHTISTAYVLNKPTLESFPKYFQFEDTKFLLTTIVDTESVLNDIPFSNNTTYFTQESFLTHLGLQFKTLIKHIETIRTSGNMTYIRALDYLYKESLLEEDIYTIELIPFDNYQTWISSNEQINSLISGYDRLPNSKLYYKQLCDILINLLLPTVNDLFRTYTGFNQDHSIFYNKLKKLFIQLCSYRLTFLETDRSTLSFITTPHMVIGNIDGLHTDVSSLPIPELSIVSSSTDSHLIDLTVFDGVTVQEMYTDITDSNYIKHGEDFTQIESNTSDIIFTEDLITIKGFDDIEDTSVTSLSTGSSVFTFIEPLN